jgi:hypothetical protein
MQLDAVAAPGNAEYRPEGHGRQLVESDPPDCGEYVPAAQFTQRVLEPSPEANFPAAQLVQAAAPVADDWPAAHASQAVDALAPTRVPYIPEAQLVQLAEPGLTA